MIKKKVNNTSAIEITVADILELGAEMEIEYYNLLNMTWLEFNYYYYGYIRRLERGWDYTRHIIASNYNSTGMSKKAIQPAEIMKLSYIEKEKPIERKMSPERIQKLKARRK